MEIASAIERSTTATRPRRPRLVLGATALGVLGVVGIALLARPPGGAAGAPIYTPQDDEHVVARVSPRDASEQRARLSSAANRSVPLEISLESARREIMRYRESADPRHLGRAQAVLGAWWNRSDAGPEVLLLRATIRQSHHEFTDARADLDRLIALAPTHVQGHLTRAVVATVTADYVAARESCTALATLAPPLVTSACLAPLDALAGDATGAYARLAQVVARSRGVSPAVAGWALTLLAEISVMRGDHRQAEQHLRAALQVDANDVYARDALADVLLETDRATDASALLAGRESIDSHLLRRAIAEVERMGPAAPALVAELRARMRAADARDDRVHLREASRFALAVERTPARAVELARANWSVQKELADARLLARAAIAASDESALDLVHTWARATGVRDAELDRTLAVAP